MTVWNDTLWRNEIMSPKTFLLPCSETVTISDRLIFIIVLISPPLEWIKTTQEYVSTNKANWAQISEVWKRRFWWTDHCHISGKLIMSDSSRGKQTAEIYTCPVQDLIKFFTSSKTKELWHLFFKQNEFSVKKCFHVKAWPHRESDADADARCGQTLTHCNILLVKKHFSK